MNVVDRIVSFFSPQRGFKRAKYRQAIRLYDGAQVGRRANSWRGLGSSANVEISQGMKPLRNRARELVRNTPHAPRLLDILINNIIGEGITPQPNTGNDKLDDKVSMLWEDWQSDCDVEGLETFYGMQVLGLRSIIESGEGLIRFVDRELKEMPDGAKVPLQLQLLEGDYIDETRDGFVSRSRPENGDPERSRLGVGLGEYDKRLGLWLWPNHPGEQTYNPKLLQNSKFVPDNELLHLFMRLRPGQVRGVTWFTAMLQTARDLADFMDAVNVKARAEACFVGFIEQLDELESVMEPGAMTADMRSLDNPDAMVSTLEPGMVKLLKPGQKITFGQPTGTTQAESVMMFSLMAMAASIGATYDQLSGDLRGANYSSLRAGKLEFKRMCSRFQQTFFIPRCCNRVWKRFISRAILAGVINERKGGYPVEWTVPAWESVNPKLDLAAEELSVRAGRMTPQEYYAQWGSNWRKNIRDIKKFNDYCDEHNVEVDLDPRKFTRVGIKQSVQPGQAAPGAAGPAGASPGGAAGDAAAPGAAVASPASTAPANLQITLVDADGNPVDLSDLADSSGDNG